MPRHFSRFFAVALLVAACGCGSSGKRRAADSGTDRGPDTPTSVTGDADLDTAAPAAPDTSPDGPNVDQTVDMWLAEIPDGAAPDARDAAVSDTADASDAGIADALTSCGAGLTGTAPFGKALTGTATFASTRATVAPITTTMIAYIYFPAGRVAGAPVQLAMKSRVVASQYFFGTSVILASDLSATGLSVGGHDMQIIGNLLPGDGGLQASVSANFSSPSTDVADDRSASMLMCPAGEVPAPTLQVSGGTLSPLSKLGINSSAPLSTEALSALRVASPLGAVAVKVTAEVNSRFSGGPNFTVTPVASAFPSGQPLTFDASAVKDVLGRNVQLSLATTQVLATTAVLDDLTLTTTPPAGALACTGCTASPLPGVDGGAMLRCTGGGKVSNGVLSVSRAGADATEPVVAMLALPVTTLTKLRVRMSVGDVVEGGSGCRSGFGLASLAWGTIAVVGPNGESSAPVTLTCDGAMVDRVLDLPSASPLWLVVHLQASAPKPFFMPTPGPPSLHIDELQFM